MKYFIYSFLLSISISSIFAQDLSLPKKSVENPWRFGGDFGFSLGSHDKTLHIAPSCGYMVTKNWEIGGSLGYTYNKYDDYKFNVFTSGIFSNYQIIPEAFLRINYEFHTGNQKINNFSDSFTENSLWVGGGYQNSGRVRFQTGLMYNLLYDKNNSIYNSPWQPFAGVSISF